MLSQDAVSGVQPDLSEYEKAGTASAFDEALKNALFGTTTIEGAYIKTGLIDTDNLYATHLNASYGTIGGFSITSSSLHGMDLYGNT